MRVSLLSYKMPELSGPYNGCFGKVPRHDESQDRRQVYYNYIKKRYFDTTTNDTYYKKFKDFKPRDTKSIATSNVSAGIPSDRKNVESVKITTRLISEKYNGIIFIKSQLVMNLNIIQFVKEHGTFITILELTLQKY